MATIKTSELTGPALDWAVLIAQFPIMREARPKAAIITGGNPSTNWATGGPIIEHSKMGFSPWGREWRAWIYWRGSFRPGSMYYGDTPLIAAMRCYVASKLGDTVDIPDELVS